MTRPSRLVAFSFAAALAPHAAAQFTNRASVDSAGAGVLGPSWDASISDDGLRVAFTSLSSGLAPDDGNGVSDVYVRDVLRETTVRASTTPDGIEPDASCEQPVISGDGRWVAFVSLSTRLDPSGLGGLFVRDLEGGALRLAAPTTARTSAHSPALSADGRFLAYLRYVVRVQERVYEIHVLDLATNADELLGNAADINVSPSISGDGRIVAWEAAAAPGLTRCAVYDRATGTSTFADVAADGSAPDGAAGGPSLSSDGSLIAFSSNASNLVAGDTNGTWDVFVRDLRGGRIARISLDSAGAEGNEHSRGAAISPDGHYVAFRSRASNLVTGDDNGYADVFVRNLRNSTTHVVSVSSTGELGRGPASTGRLGISALGPHVAFADEAANLVDGDDNVASDVFVRSLRGVRVVRLGPAVGSEDGGEVVHLSGSDLSALDGAQVQFGGASALVLSAEPSRLLVRTPPGRGVVDVVVSNRFGESRLAGAYTYVAPEIAARYGNVNVGRADREDVILLNSLVGDPLTRELDVPTGRPLSLVAIPPSSLASARFVLYAWRGVPSRSTLFSLPGRLGRLVLPPPFAPGGPYPVVVWNNIGHGGVLGVPTLPSRPAPSIVISDRAGAPRPANATLQGLIEDSGSLVPQGVSVTNALVVRFRAP
jgi:Tol biopolymer transport system component